MAKKKKQKHPIKLNNEHPTGKAINKHNAALREAFNASSGTPKKKKKKK